MSTSRRSRRASRRSSAADFGSKLIKMEFTDAAQAGRSVKTVDVPHEQRNRFSITDAEVIELAKYAVIIEKHYGRPMDIEWGKDGRDGKLYILQARPETVKSAGSGRDRAALQAEEHRRPCWPQAAPSVRRSARVRCA